MLLITICLCSGFIVVKQLKAASHPLRRLPGSYIRGLSIFKYVNGNLRRSSMDLLTTFGTHPLEALIENQIGDNVCACHLTSDLDEQVFIQIW